MTRLTAEFVAKAPWRNGLHAKRLQTRHCAGARAVDRTPAPARRPRRSAAPWTCSPPTPAASTSCGNRRVAAQAAQPPPIPLPPPCRPRTVHRLGRPDPAAASPGCALAGTDPDLAQLVGELLLKSPDFAGCGNATSSAATAPAPSTSTASQVGALTLGCQSVQLENTPDHRLVAYYAETRYPEPVGR
ncbi:hypothetical protein ACIA6C_15235 [Streptomyces sp. NPDC051578]|uniref:MmyB family transcriptional regulator n=1 Tax=Streptomyces sp. NPDC051578 TaxID=3365662 RepID=UPI0037AC1589